MNCNYDAFTITTVIIALVILFCCISILFLGPGFWIRFTVHYNLCVGTVLGLGGPEQIQQLRDMQAAGQLGCFGLTERLAGVNSGLVVQTTADWDNDTKEFVLNTPTADARKNWISQGLIADKAVVVADLRIAGKSVGPHAFFMDLRKPVSKGSPVVAKGEVIGEIVYGGEVVAGVSHGDMGKKTVGNDLDNAWIAFTNVRLPRGALLNRFADIDENGNYVQKVKGIPVFHMIGQRLFSGGLTSRFS